MENPFTVEPPDGIPLKKFLQLFYDVTPEFPKLIGSQHVFIEGPRGTGKSMMFRYLLPECQCRDGKRLNDIDFFAALIPIKKSELITSDVSKLESEYGQSILSEYIMVTFVAKQVFASIYDSVQHMDSLPSEIAREYFSDVFLPTLKRTGVTSEYSAEVLKEFNAEKIFKLIRDILHDQYSSAINYVRRQSLRDKTESYNGPLGGFLDFLFPLLSQLRQLPFMPNGPIYLLVDDADDLDLTQTKILNSWVASRTTRDICVKISTQQRYKTFATSTGQRIEAPHDFSLINISSVYTSNKNYYQDFVKTIVKKRLAWVNIETQPADFFASDSEQESKIEEIANALRIQHREGKGFGYRESDDVVRYARPDFMRSLAGNSKSTYSYSYSGLNQLIHISSGVIRHFLEPAARMYAEQSTALSDHQIRARQIVTISPSIQNKNIRSYSSEFLNQEFDKLCAEAFSTGNAEEIQGYQRMRNFIKALGGLFKIRILSENFRERKVFSVAVPDLISKETRSILKRATEFGYLHQSTIGNKDGTGRSTLYILHRRLAPEFYLDPTGFAGYLRITDTDILESAESPERFLRKKQNEADKKNSENLDEQGSLF